MIGIEQSPKPNVCSPNNSSSQSISRSGDVGSKRELIQSQPKNEEDRSIIPNILLELPQSPLGVINCNPEQHCSQDQFYERSRFIHKSTLIDHSRQKKYTINSIHEVEVELYPRCTDECKIQSVIFIHQNRWLMTLEILSIILSCGLIHLLMMIKQKIRYNLFFINSTAQLSTGVAVRGPSGDFQIKQYISNSAYISKKELKVFEYRFQRFVLTILANSPEKRIFKPFGSNPFLMKSTEMAALGERKTIVRQEEVEESRARNGTNQTDVPDRGLLFLCLREFLSPFYFFQIGSCILWNYEGYKIYMYVIIIMASAGYIIKVFNERQSFLQLKRFSYHRRDVVVLRAGSRRAFTNESIIIGDVVQIQKGEIALCDMLVITGSAVVNEAMLSGDCMPIVKTTYDSSESDLFEEKNQNVIYSGSTVLSTFNLKCIAYKVGFQTLRGTIIRSILYPIEDTSNVSFDKDKLYFITILLILASISFLSSLSMFIEKLNQEIILPKDVIIRCLDLVTISVPPALPTCLSFSLSFIINRLRRQGVRSIDSEKISICGILRVMSFDKTGTLTESMMNHKMISSFEGYNQTFIEEADPLVLTQKGGNEDKYSQLTISPLHPSRRDISKSIEKSENLQKVFSNSLTSSAIAMNRLIMGACHSLRLLDDATIVGDPLDVEMFKRSGWMIADLSERKLQRKGDGVIQEIFNFAFQEDKIHVLKVFAFESQFERLSSIIRYNNATYLLSKGSPEQVKLICRADSLPKQQSGEDSYEGRVSYYTKLGYRVITLCCREINAYSIGKQRQRLEKNMIFTGFLVFENQLKKGTIEDLRLLREAHISMNMITGDHPQTSINIAKQCGILQQNDSSHLPSSYILDYEKNQITSEPINQTILTYPTPLKSLREFLNNVSDYKKLELVVTGRFFEKFFNDPLLNISILRKLLICTKVFARMKSLQKQTLVRLLQEHANLSQYTFVGMCGDGANDSLALEYSNVGIALGETEASMAATITSRLPSINVIQLILREGRCSLTTFYECFKFMGMYSLIQLSTTTILYYRGVAPSDYQFLYWDLFIVLPLMFLIGPTQASEKLTKETPSHRLLSPNNVLTVIGLGAIHLFFQVISIVISAEQPWYISPMTYQSLGGGEVDALITNSFDNTVIFWISNAQYIYTLISISIGSPFKRFFLTNILYTIYLILITVFSIYLMFTINNDVIELFQINPELWTTDLETQLGDMAFYWRFVILIIIAINLLVTVAYDHYIVPKITQWMLNKYPSLQYRGMLDTDSLINKNPEFSSQLINISQKKNEATINTVAS